MNLTPKQKTFVDACRTAGLSSPAKRSDLVAVANDLGMKYAPAWIVQNSDMRTSERGMFLVPGLDDSGSAAAAPAPVAAKPEVKGATPAASLNAEISAIRGMTAGAATLIPDTLKTYVPWGHHDTVETVINLSLIHI